MLNPSLREVVHVESDPALESPLDRGCDASRCLTDYHTYCDCCPGGAKKQGAPAFANARPPG